MGKRQRGHPGVAALGGEALAVEFDELQGQLFAGCDPRFSSTFLTVNPHCSTHRPQIAAILPHKMWGFDFHSDTTECSSRHAAVTSFGSADRTAKNIRQSLCPPPMLRIRASNGSVSFVHKERCHGQ